MSKLWIIGDSFTGKTFCGNPSWGEILCDRFKGDDYFISSRASRDFQTILDIFLRNLKYISQDDFVILVIPFLGRTRLPLQTPVHDTMHSKYDDPVHQHLDYFIGTSSWTKDQENYRLEDPLMYIDETELKNQTQTWSVVSASLASKRNYIRILQSLKQYLPFQMYIFTWLDDVDCDIVETKSQITQGVGYWHTLYDVWKETNGKEGIEGDHHFSVKMHDGFSDYLTNKFPQYFNKDK